MLATGKGQSDVAAQEALEKVVVSAKAYVATARRVPTSTMIQSYL